MVPKPELGNQKEYLNASAEGINLLPELASRRMAAGSDEALRLVPARQFGLEQAMEFINQDELVEVTPASIRLRKIAG